MQTDGILFGANEAFITKEQMELIKAGFMAKDREMLLTLARLNFKGGKIHLEKDNSITVTQTQNCENLILIFPEPVNTTSPRNKTRK